MLGATLTLLLTSAAKGLVAYEQNFNGVPAGTTGSGLNDGSFITSGTGVAKVVNLSGWQGLQLTQEGIQNTLNADYNLPDLNPGQAISSFTATFDSMIYNNAGTPADAWSFNFGNLGSSDVLTVSFTTYRTNQIQVSYNGAQIGGSYGTPIVHTNTAESSFNATIISWNEDDGLSLSYGGTELISGLTIAGFDPAAGNKFSFDAWNGSESQGVFIDNLTIDTVAVPEVSSFTALLSLGALAYALRRKRR